MIVRGTLVFVCSALYRLQRFNEVNKLRNFTIIPQYSSGRKAIHIDTQTMTRLINSLNPKRDGTKIPHAENNPINTWSRFINYFKFENGARHFDFALITDGLAVGVLQFKRPEKPKLDDDEKQRIEVQRLKTINNSHKNNQFSKIIGVDEGAKLMVAAHADCTVDGIVTHKLTKYKSRSFQFDSAQLYFKRKSREITKNALDKVEHDRGTFEIQNPNSGGRGFTLMQELRDEDLIKRRAAAREKVRARLLEKQSKNQLSKRQQRSLTKQAKWNKIDEYHRMELSNRSFNYLSYAEFQLKHLKALQVPLASPTIAHYKFKQKLLINRTVDNIAKELVETGEIKANKRVSYKLEDKITKNSFQARDSRRGHFKQNKASTLIFIGDLRMTPNSPMKGHPHTPMASLKAALARRATVVVVDEYLTTKTCRTFKLRLEVSKPPKRFSQCVPCSDRKRKVWNRDIVAACNIKDLGLLKIQNLPRPAEFLRGFRYQKRPKLRRNPSHSDKDSNSNGDSDRDND